MAELGLPGVKVTASDVQPDGHSTVLSRSSEELPGYAGLNIRGVVLVREVEQSLIAGTRQGVDLLLLVLAGLGRIEELGLERRSKRILESCLRDYQMRGRPRTRHSVGARRGSTCRVRRGLEVG